MAKWDDLVDDTENIIDEVMDNAGLAGVIRYKVIANNDQKNDVIKVKKITPDLQYAFNTDLLIIVNEVIFEQIPDELQKLTATHALSGTHVNDNGNLTVAKPDVVGYSGFMDKYPDISIKIRETIKSLYDKKKNDESKENN
tara:strand:- start:2979 stop:3401 length:423 start_codon:yes stop_codon:yes gene_type:complete